MLYSQYMVMAVHSAWIMDASKWTILYKDHTCIQRDENLCSTNSVQLGWLFHSSRKGLNIYCS